MKDMKRLHRVCFTPNYEVKVPARPPEEKKNTHLIKNNILSVSANARAASKEKERFRSPYGKELPNSKWRTTIDKILDEKESDDESDLENVVSTRI